MTRSQKYYKNPTKKNKQINRINNKNRYLLNTQRDIKKETKYLAKQPLHKNKTRKLTLKNTLNSSKEILKKMGGQLQEKKMFGGEDSLTVTGTLKTFDIMKSLLVLKEVLNIIDESEEVPGIKETFIQNLNKTIIELNNKYKGYDNHKDYEELTDISTASDIIDDMIFEVYELGYLDEEINIVGTLKTNNNDNQPVSSIGTSKRLGNAVGKLMPSLFARTEKQGLPQGL